MHAHQVKCSTSGVPGNPSVNVLCVISGGANEDAAAGVWRDLSLPGAGVPGIAARPVSGHTAAAQHLQVTVNLL